MNKCSSSCTNRQTCHNDTKNCCWCADKRDIIEKSIVYLDRFGFINLEKYGISIPVDIHYCPSCKHSDVTRDTLLKMLCLQLTDNEAESLEKAEQSRLINLERQEMAKEK